MSFYSFKNYDTGKFLDANVDKKVYTHSQTGGEHQIWIWNGRNLRQLSTGNILDSNENGDVYTQESNGEEHQEWVIQPTVKGCVYLKYYQTGLYLDSIADQRVYTHQKAQVPHQMWQQINKLE